MVVLDKEKGVSLNPLLEENDEEAEQISESLTIVVLYVMFVVEMGYILMH